MIYYIYKKTYNSDPHDEQNVTISIVRQAEAGEGKENIDYYGDTFSQSGILSGECRRGYQSGTDKR